MAACFSALVASAARTGCAEPSPPIIPIPITAAPIHLCMACPPLENGVHFSLRVRKPATPARAETPPLGTSPPGPGAPPDTPNHTPAAHGPARSDKLQPTILPTVGGQGLRLDRIRTPEFKPPRGRDAVPRG